MKRFLLSCLLLGVAISLGAQSGKVVTDSLYSQKLSTVQKYNVYLPAGYREANIYPVIYLLHGLWGCYKDWVEMGQMTRVADLLMASGECVPAVIVMPNAGDADAIHYQCGYFNVEGWPYEDHFFQELLPEVERKYHCGGSKGQRAVMGLSMGGGGTIVYAQRHPELFSSAYGMSAWLEMKGRASRGAELENSKIAITDRSVEEHSALDFIDAADDATLEKLKTVKWYLDCGDDDFLLQQSEGLHQKMKARGLRGELRVRDGAHTWEYWHTALYQSLPFASRNFSR